MRNKSKGSTYCEARISISLHKKDLETLKCIKAYFNGKGSIVKHGEDSLQYVITSIDQLSTLVIPHFDNYPLISQKYADYLLFKKAVHLIRNKGHLSIEPRAPLFSFYPFGPDPWSCAQAPWVFF